MVDAFSQVVHIYIAQLPYVLQEQNNSEGSGAQCKMRWNHGADLTTIHICSYPHVQCQHTSIGDALTEH